MKTISEQMSMFGRHDSSKQVLQCVKEGHSLCYQAQFELFNLENALEVLEEYLQKRPLYHDVVKKLFDFLKSK